MSWTILRSAPVAEFKARDELHRCGLAAYVPVEFQVARYGRGRETVRRSPIIRGYVFASVPLEAWREVAAVREIKGALLVEGRPARLSQTEVDAVELLSRPLHRANRTGWSPGDRVAIQRGAFATLEGVVRRIERGRVVTALTMFGRVVEVPVAPADVAAA